ncbi:GNAT family N-acetyltransferase [Planococcus beigongshangi]|uniref:GNAT family N-acetyltransferase n=1 Tax=Planococcus beigongshangi TaxID=2782536 RepID=UPI00193C4D1F|nr:GNAT family N-acetyltransferase [Planococcus beigongshangi]
MKFPVLETPRLQLVQIGPEHTDALFDILSRDEVTRYYGMDSIEDRLIAEKMIQAFQFGFESQRSFRWGLQLKGSGEFIGTIGLNNLNVGSKKSEIGYELHPAYWRKGLAKEAVLEVLRYAFTELALYRMGAVTYPANEASSGMLKKLGFKEEGKLRGYLYQRGKSHDALIFSLLEPEWKEMGADGNG